MRTPKQSFGFNHKVLVLALLAALDSAYAADDEVAQLIKPDSAVVGVGLGVVTGNTEDRAIFGQYNGWRKNWSGLLLDYELIKRDDASGLWTNVEVNNLGLDNRELRFSQQKQGDWKYSAQYSELTRHDPRTINPGPASIDPELKRKSYSLSAERWMTKQVSVEASFKSENKDGSRLFGVGNFCSNVIAGLPCTTTTAGALLLVPEPIDSTIQQFEAKVNYAGEAFLLSGGYYGSFYKNSNKTLTPVVPGSVNAELAAFLRQPAALPPDNEAHQLYVSGNFTPAPKTRATFNLAYTRAKQNDDFGALAVAGAPTNLGGELNRTFAQVGLTARPLNNVSLLGDWRMDDVQDDTPMNSFANTPSSLTKHNGKLEASYLAPDNYRATLGVDYAYVKRARPIDTTVIPPTSLTALREETEEVGFRFELKRSMSDTFNAALSFVHSEREGQQWIGLVADATARYPFVRFDSFAAAGNTTGTFPFTMMDRTRDKVRVVADWAATEQLALQFMAETGKDDYTAPTTSGMRDNGLNNVAVDATLTLSDKWKLAGYVNYGDQTLHVNHSVGYIAELKNVTTSFGASAVGKLSSSTEIGGDLSYMRDRNRYGLGSGNALTPGVLPDVTYRVLTLKLFGKFALDKDADLRINFIHQNAKLDEWTWASAGVPFTYSDNSTVSVQPIQKVTYLGAQYLYKFK